MRVCVFVCVYMYVGPCPYPTHTTTWSSRGLGIHTKLPFHPQVLVNTLANSKAFQKFAIRSNAMINEMAKKGVEHHSTVSQTSTEFFKAFREEVCELQ